MKRLILILIELLFFVDSTSISLCENISSSSQNDSFVPEAVVLREQKSKDERMVKALDDVECWLQKTFDSKPATRVSTVKDEEEICFRMATTPLRVGQLLVVVSEGSSVDNCTIPIYGPIPNILNVKIFVDGKKTDSTRNLELSLRTAGGRFGVQVALHRSNAAAKIQKTLQFLLEVSQKTSEYSKLLSFWKPSIDVPPPSYEYRLKAEIRKHQNQHGDAWFQVISLLPMLVFGIVVSCYIVIHPRGGLTYTDEEIDFTIQEVDSNSRVNTARDKSLEELPPMVLFTPPPPAAPEPLTAMEPALLTAVPSEVHTDVTVLSERPKSDETLRIGVREVRDECSMKTGRESEPGGKRE